MTHSMVLNLIEISAPNRNTKDETHVAKSDKVDVVYGRVEGFCKARGQRSTNDLTNKCCYLMKCTDNKEHSLSLSGESLK